MNRHDLHNSYLSIYLSMCICMFVLYGWVRLVWPSATSGEEKQMDFDCTTCSAAHSLAYNSDRVE